MTPRSRFRRVVAWLAVIVLTGACSGGGSATSSASTMCVAFGRLQAQAAQQNQPFPPLAHAQVAAIENERSKSLASLVAASKPDLSVLLSRYAAEDRAQSTLLLDAWGSDGTPLLAEVDAHDFASMSGWVARNGLQRADGSAVTNRQYVTDAALAFDELTRSCAAPPPGWHQLADNPALRVPSGAIAFVSATKTVMRGTLNADGTVTNQTRIYSGNGIEYPSFSSDGKHFLFQDDATVWITAADGSAGKPLVPAGGQHLICPNWSQDSREVVVTRRLSPGVWDLARINITTNAATGLTVPGPIRKVPCASYLNSQSLLVIQADPATRDLHLYEMGTDGTRLRPFNDIAGCSPGIAQASPDGRQILIDVECDDAYQDGLWVIPAGGTPHHVIMGHVGGPSWTPDSKHLLFGYVPLGQPTDQPALWIVSADGSMARHLSGLPGNWNSWPVAIPGG